MTGMMLSALESISKEVVKSKMLVVFLTKSAYGKVSQAPCDGAYSGEYSAFVWGC